MREKPVSHKGIYADIQNFELPIRTPEEIRASWRVLHTEKFRAQFDEHKLELYKKRIVEAWKEKINPDGPPSLDEKN